MTYTAARDLNSPRICLFGRHLLFGPPVLDGILNEDWEKSWWMRMEFLIWDCSDYDTLNQNNRACTGTTA